MSKLDLGQLARRN